MEYMTTTDKARLRATIRRAKLLWPGPVGEIAARYIDEWEEFGFRFEGHGLLARLVEQVWTTKLPDEDVILPWNEWVRVA